MLSGHVSLVATVMDSTDVEHFNTAEGCMNSAAIENFLVKGALTNETNDKCLTSSGWYAHKEHCALVLVHIHLFLRFIQLKSLMQKTKNKAKRKTKKPHTHQKKTPQMKNCPQAIKLN